jgi:DNA-binding transcriptional LysR family regulator
MRPKDVAALTAFIQVAELHSFRAAAARLGVTPSALSQTIRQLEERLGARLLNRNTRSVSLTDAGAGLFGQLQSAFNQIDGALEDLNRHRERPVGTLKIYATQGATALVIAPIWERFISTYPDVHLEVRIGHASADIVAMGFDAMVSCKAHISADMVAVPVTGPMKVALVASAAYLARHGHPQEPDELVHHRCIRYRYAPDQPLFDWLFARNGLLERINVGEQVILNSSELAVRAAIDGVGIAYTTEKQTDDFVQCGQLVKLLEEYLPSFEGLLLAYPSRRQMSTPLRAFFDMVSATYRSSTLQADGPLVEAPFR